MKFARFQSSEWQPIDNPQFSSSLPVRCLIDSAEKCRTKWDEATIRQHPQQNNKEGDENYWAFFLPLDQQWFILRHLHTGFNDFEQRFQ
ncbi:hypothetical protein T06_8902 [Trichinella sp. T6]|nr:hypothetical protein T06_8902 [Trichinella sp. T6]